MRPLPVIAAALVAALPFVSHAAVYRCPDGSFQDKPCDKGDSKVVNKRNTAGKPKPPDDFCAALGQQAGDIAKAKADGATSEKLLAEADKEDVPYAKKLERKKLIVDVYQKTGSPQEMGIIFEADCVKSREAARKQVPVVVPAQGTRQGASPAPGVGGDMSSATPDPAAAARRAAEEQKLAAAEAKTRRCESLQREREGVMSQQRKGGSISSMESLNRSRQDIDKQISVAGCN